MLLIIIIVAVVVLLMDTLINYIKEGFIVDDLQDFHNTRRIIEDTYRYVSPTFDDNIEINEEPYVFNPIGYNYSDYLNAASPYDCETRILSTSTKGLPGTEASYRLSVVPVPVPANYSLPLV